MPTGKVSHPVYHHGLIIPPTHHHGAIPVHHGAEATAETLRSSSDILPDGQYNYEYETNNGIVAKESGLAAKSVQGSFGWTSPEGTPVQITYVADENGYQPTGNVLPVAPETPAHVLRLVQYLNSVPSQEYRTGRIAIPVTAKPAFAPFRFNKF